jgi:hypothetical protein
MLLNLKSLLVVVSLLASVEAFSASAKTIVIDTKALSMMTPESFAQMLILAKSIGTTELIFQDAKPQALKVGSADDSYPGGDAYFLQGLTTVEDKDKKMRQVEYKSLFPIVDYLSKRRMRVTVNLLANTRDLLAVFKTDRPSIVIWSSHGNDEYFYGANGEQIPHSVFKHVSKSVYQFVLSACYGRKALDDYYLKELPKNRSLETRGWKGLTNSDEMISYLMSDAWTMYVGRADYQNAGLRCDGKIMTRTSDNSVMAEYSDIGGCGNAVIQAQDNFVCIEEKNKSTSIWSISRREKIWGEPYEDFDTCAERLTRAFDKKVCRRQNGEYRAVDSVSGKVGAEAHMTMRECEESLVSGISL